MSEIWKDIEGYEGKYQVSNTGKVRSSTSGQWKLLKAYMTRDYPSVSLCNGRKGRRTEFVHRLVALAFIPNPFNYREINHKDENKQNNHADNLEWCTRAYNMSYGTARLRQGISFGTPVEQVTTSGIVIARYRSARTASELCGIDESSIAKCCRGERKYAGGYIWRYSTEF